MDNFVNICIVTFNRLEYTIKCIESVLSYTDYPHVVSVVDNFSQDGTREYLNDLKSKGLIKNLVLLDENIGVAKASNIVWLLEPSSAYYLKLDNDMVFLKSPWLGPMLETLNSTPATGAVAYKTENIAYPTQLINGRNLRVKHGNLGGACILIPKYTEKLIGYWCEDYGLYGQEDLDYGIRIQLTGLLNIYMEDDQTAIHVDSGSDSAYAEWKKQQFEKNNLYAKIVENVYGFFRGIRPLYYKPAFAMGYLSISESSFSNDVQDSINRMLSFVNNGNYKEAITEAEKLLQEYPGFAFLHKYLTSFYQATGNQNKAAYHYEQAISVNPFIHDIPPNLAQAYEAFMKI
jgi:GT2 family glycosyltransferase